MAFISKVDPKTVNEALFDVDCIIVQEELAQFERN